ncbi:AAA family ATPase [Candidatus Palauibacter sp.]|uniref:AAA family ATPase n=1 Tax=Candidatus Palauibacter sp. TaxID=3101350 RepID=UPI003B521ADB
MTRFGAGEEPVSGFRVQFPIKRSANADTYRIVDHDGRLGFLKVFDRTRLPHDRFDARGQLREIAALASLSHEGIPEVWAHGETPVPDSSPYVLTRFVPGETLHERLRREYAVEPLIAKALMRSLLDVVAYLHELGDPLFHNELNPRNIMLDLGGDGAGGATQVRPLLIDFGHATRGSETGATAPAQVNPYFQATECFDGTCSIATDIFALGAVYYQMLFGVPPWHLDVSHYRAARMDLQRELADRRKEPLSLRAKGPAGHVSRSTAEVLRTALSSSPGDRLGDASQFRRALSGRSARRSRPGAGGRKPARGGVAAGATPTRPASHSGTPRGFDAVAGMDDLKNLLINDVVNVLRDPERYAAYGLTIRNGLLLYGPPGCGKTFLAQRLAEETHLTFHAPRPSDLASIYVHGTQEKIGQLFEDARRNAPSVLFLDEFDALAPTREQHTHPSQSGEVNEFLSQLDDASEDGIFVIAATNRPDAIDPAILRPGRFDKAVYVGPPDHAARKAMFRLLLEGRPSADGLDADALAAMTEGRVSSDIQLIVDEAARAALGEGAPIGMAHLVEADRCNPPSVSPEAIRDYERMELDGRRSGSGGRRRIGF